MSPKRTFVLEDLVKEAESSCSELDRLSERMEDAAKIMKLVKARLSIPVDLPRAVQQVLFAEHGISIEDVDLLGETGVGLDRCRPFSEENSFIIFAPPVSCCVECSAELSLRTRCAVKFVTLEGIKIGEKMSLKCYKCNITYTYSKFGDVSHGMKFYEAERGAVEASNVVFLSKKLCEFQANLANHAWVSFEGFAESFNQYACDDDGGIDRRTFSTGWYWYEVEKELRRIRKIDFLFSKSASNFTDALPMIESRRQRTIYNHTCTDWCLEKGCGKMIVFDGIWKLTFTHCMMISRNVVEGVPLLNLPDVCTAEPKPGHAFCCLHVDALNKFNETNDPIPTTLRDFLKYCGVTFKGKPMITAKNVDGHDHVYLYVTVACKYLA